ncbi:TPA: hypothetical protein L9A94_003250 [Klebsiella pneumoniae]|nr:hypothetical protein [Klebsiella pneumoniae]
MTIPILSGNFSSEQTDYGFCYATVSDVGELSNSRFPITISVFSDVGMADKVYERGDIFIDFISENETSDLVKIRALDNFRLSLAPLMAMSDTNRE